MHEAMPESEGFLRHQPCRLRAVPLACLAQFLFCSSFYIGLYRDNGKENGNYYRGSIGFRDLSVGLKCSISIILCCLVL